MKPWPSWTRVAAIYEIGRSQLHGLTPLLRDLDTHDDELVRETVAWTLGQLESVSGR